MKHWFSMKTLPTDNNYVSTKKSTLHFHLKCPSREVISLSIKNNADVLTRVVFDEVEKATGIPVQQQMLISGRHFLRPDIKLEEFHLKDGCCVHLSVRGLGGGRSDSGIIIGHMHPVTDSTLTELLILLAGLVYLKCP